jgi:parvulin-like peptidyl-prolyl isomerase
MTHKLGRRVVILLAGTLSLMVVSASAEILEQILVKVNGEILTKTELEQRQVVALRGRNISTSDRDALQKAIEDLTPELVMEAVDELLLTQRGRELGYRLSDERFKTIVENIKKENKIETDEQFEEALRSEDMTMADLRKVIEKQMLISQVQQVEVTAKIGVSEAEERAYYDSHLSEFTKSSEITLREILVSVPDDGKAINVGLDEEAKQKAEALRARVVAGESFEQLAAEHSDAPSKANGGLIGPIPQVEIAPTLQTMLASMKPGDVTEVLRTRTGYQILKLESATEPVTTPFEQARPEVADKVYAQKRRGEILKYIKKLRSQAIIEWKNEEIRKAWEQALAQQDTSVP